MKSYRFLFNKMLAAVAAILLLLCSSPAWANSTPFSDIYVFGDSLSDMGRFYQLSGGAPPSPYWEGRFSNGQVWVEYVAEYLGMPLSKENNFAVGGAASGSLNYRNGFLGKTYPGVMDEVGWFVSAPPPADVEDALFIYWSGANDVLIMLGTKAKPEDMILNGVMNTVNSVQALYLAGARHIVVVNMTDIGLTPFAMAYGIAPEMTALSVAYNEALSGALDLLETIGIHTIRVDAFKALNSMVNSPEQYGFIDTTHPALMMPGTDEGYIFWDEAHPTTAAHKVMASEAVLTIIREYSPRQSQKIPLRSAASLKGLVK